MDDYSSVMESIEAVARLFGIEYAKTPAQLRLKIDTSYLLSISSGIHVSHFSRLPGTNKERWYLLIVFPVVVEEAAVKLHQRFLEYCRHHGLKICKSNIFHNSECNSPYLVTFEIAESDLLDRHLTEHFEFVVVYTFKGE